MSPDIELCSMKANIYSALSANPLILDNRREKLLKNGHCCVGEKKMIITKGKKHTAEKGKQRGRRNIEEASA